MFPASSGERFQGNLLQTEFTFSVPRGRSRILVCDIGEVQTTLPEVFGGHTATLPLCHFDRWSLGCQAPEAKWKRVSSSPLFNWNFSP